MNKKEQREMDELRKQLALAKALSWPPYKPVPLNIPLGSPLTVGWTQHNWWDNFRIEQGCSDGLYHSDHDTTKTTTQGAGVLYGTKLEALQAVRLEATQRCAELLARIDMEIDR